MAGYLTDKIKKQKAGVSSAKTEDDSLKISEQELKMPEMNVRGVRTPFIKKYLPAFIGGILLLFGARMAYC